ALTDPAARRPCDPRPPGCNRRVAVPATSRASLLLRLPRFLWERGAECRGCGRSGLVPGTTVLLGTAKPTTATVTRSRVPHRVPAGPPPHRTSTPTTTASTTRPSSNSAPIRTTPTPTTTASTTGPRSTTPTPTR